MTAGIYWNTIGESGEETMRFGLNVISAWPRALRESVAYILRDREERNLRPFEVVYSVELSEDYEKIRETVGCLQEVGVTWVLESIHGIRYLRGQAMKRILKGPPVVG